jgi:hypothetical protein
LVLRRDCIGKEIDIGGRGQTAVRNISTLQNLVRELGTGFEGELLGENEGIVAVEKKGGDLVRGLALLIRCNDVLSARAARLHARVTLGEEIETYFLRHDC